ncbi:MAG: YjgP/YjgQ family permease [Candidatus Omnitrophica bacterium]|nr:YjgP/YjgQ family permease [Candidatus Omnitrophota bacterium]
MRILRSYIIKELFGPFALSLIVFTFVLLMGNIIQLAELLITKGVEITYVVKLFFNLIPYLLSYTLPMSILTSVLLTFGKLSSDNEITAIRASGISLISILVPVLVVGILFCMLSIYLNDRVLPKSHFTSRKILSEIGFKKPTAYLEAGTFIKTFKKYIIFIYSIEKNKLHNIRIYEPLKGKSTRTIIAKHGEFIPLPEQKLIKLKLIDGVSDEPNPENPNNFFKLSFKTYFITLDLAEDQKGSNIEKKPKDMTIEELEEEIKNFAKENIDPSPLLTEIHKKISLSFASLAFVIIGLPLAIRTKRHEKSIGFGMSLVIIMVYYLLLAFGEALALRQLCPPPVAMWFSNVLLVLIGAILFCRLEAR